MASKVNHSVLSFGSSSETIPRTIAVHHPWRSVLWLIVADAAAFVVSLTIALGLRSHLVTNPTQAIWGPLWFGLAAVLTANTLVGLYPGIATNPVDELRRDCIATTGAFATIWVSTSIFTTFSNSRLLYALAFLLCLFLKPVFRALVRHLFSRRSWWGSQVAILGMGDCGKLLYQTLLANPHIGLKPFAVLDDDEARYSDIGPNVVCGPLSECLTITKKHRVSYGIICMPSLQRDELLSLIDLYGSCFSHILVIPNLVGMTSLGISAREMGGIVGLEVKCQLLRPLPRAAKRMLDLLIVCFLAPVVATIVAITALLIKLEGDGPVFYANERVGHGGEIFKAWKLRSMLVNGEQVLAEYLFNNPSEAFEFHAHQKLRKDPRITRVGALIRKLSIDELPQLWNVLAGQMSLVGPRPMLASQVPLYGPSFNLYKQVRPGITGLWQVSGRNELSFADRVRLDKYVIQNWSVWLDVYILARTASVVLTGKGAY